MNETPTQAMTRYLREHAALYYPEFKPAPVLVKLRRLMPHSTSIIYRFDLNAKKIQRCVVVKTPAVNGKLYRLVEQTDPEIKFRLEYEALAALHDYFQALDDPRFGEIRPLDFLPDCFAIIMEDIRQPSLRQLFAKASRFHAQAYIKALHVPFRHAGAWLRAFAALPGKDHVPAHDIYRDDFIRGITQHTELLGSVLGHEPFFRRLAAKVSSDALAALPAALPVGLEHGDFAMRNLLIGPHGRITGLDTQAKWRVPIYDDLAYFLIGLITTSAQVLSGGLAYDATHLTRYENEFLRGYFEEAPIPFEAIRLYKIKVLLNKWATDLFRAKLARGQRRYGRQVLHAVSNRFFRKTLEGLAEKSVREICSIQRDSVAA